jgi:hypothetical protein
VVVERLFIVLLLEAKTNECRNYDSHHLFVRSGNDRDNVMAQWQGKFERATHCREKKKHREDA